MMKNNYNIILFYIMPKGNSGTRNRKCRKGRRSRRGRRGGGGASGLNTKPKSSKAPTGYSNKPRRQKESHVYHELHHTKVGLPKEEPIYAEVGPPKKPTYEKFYENSMGSDSLTNHKAGIKGNHYEEIQPTSSQKLYFNKTAKAIAAIKVPPPLPPYRNRNKVSAPPPPPPRQIYH